MKLRINEELREEIPRRQVKEYKNINKIEKVFHWEKKT